MFKSKAPSLAPETDYTKNLRENSFYRYGHLRSLGLTGEITALAVDPILSLFAVGTSSGLVHVYGAPPFQFTLPVSTISSSGPAQAVKFLFFHPGHHRLIIIDAGNTLHTYSLQQMTDNPNPLNHPPLPTKEISYTLWGTVTSVDQPLPSHTHLFFTIKDGTTLTWDLSRRGLGSWKVGNCWQDYENRMIRSGIPGRRKTLGGPMATCIAINPRDLNILLIGYEGGVVAWDIQKNEVAKTFEMTLPPGAPGGGSYQDADGSLWTERTPSVTSIAWRPDGLVFVVGHADGCMTFWAYSEPDKPLMVRTITHEDVNVTDAESLFDAGALLNQIRKIEKDQDGNIVTSAVAANREPVYKLAWASFPDQLALKAIMAAQGTEAAGEPLSNATVDYAERGETLLLVLGGQSPGEKPGISILQFPAYKPPVMGRRGTTPQSPSESMPLQERYAYRDSLAPTGSSNYLTKTPPEDFVLIPRTNPYFNLCHDPIAIIVSLTPDPNLPPIKEPTATRGLEAWVFPPPRSNVIPPSPGRKNFVQPGEGEKIVAMTPAPVLSPTPVTPGRASPGGWRLPWTAAAPTTPTTSSPTLSVPTPGSSYGGNTRRQAKIRRQLRPPSAIWSGGMTLLGCELVALTTPMFKRLISFSIENAGNEDVPRIPLHGGMAVPDLQSHGAPDVKVAKLESYRILVTFHADATVRFWDASPHLLLLPTPLRFEYPGPLPHLTISLGEYLKHPDVAHLPLAQLWQTDRTKVKIKSVHLAREALECVITMVSGEVIVTKFGEAKGKARGEDDIEELDDEGGEKGDSYFPVMPAQEEAGGSGGNGWVEEVTEIGHLAKWKVDGFKPVAIFTLKRGEPLSCAVSDIGFIAVAFASKSLAIIDMRGPDVILREGFDEDGLLMKKKKKKGNVQNVVGESSVVGAMKWVVAGMGADVTNRPRLIVSYAKGMTKIYVLINVLGEWVVETKPPTFTNESLAGPLASFVLDPITGSELNASSESLQAAMRDMAAAEHQHGKGKDVPTHCLWIAASRKSIRCAVNFNGERVAKVELEEEELSDVFYVTRHGQKVLVAVTTTGTAMFYSVPFLQYITRLDLFFGLQGRPIGRLSIDDRSGDFIEYSGPLDINIRTFFHFRKPYPPRVDPCAVKKFVPPQPTPLTASTMVGAWIWGGAPLTGVQLDALLGGPSRPPPPKVPPPPPKPLISWGKPPDEPEKVVPSAANVAPKRTAVHKQKAPVRDARERDDVYSEMTNTAALRGDYLDTLGDSLNNVSASASQYLSQAKNTAMKEAAKSTARGVFGKLL
ncbi:hypothetical protein CI109_104529 [Kwoniella shandongensis]|uniref:Uncharacterized protein n=1 Tax=Kwoniella shandongensis TaxID=1734106 RepID=A0A5M6BXI6_9TREE|nr:uncharacterized protein CI109_005580 [Kwoniella shandongensis]KAA5526145.1 hypothetical protein CI109_005580 [Kwoniella shandongensis]